jgi:uncharacterized UPF0160 family protein
MKKIKNIEIITHNRTFHQDEVMAIALLEIYVNEGKTNITRTRDETILKKGRLDPNVFVIDVGFDFNPEMLNFDHHQQNINVEWHDGTPFSSCGLIWIWIKNNKYLNESMNSETITMLEENFIKKIDKVDNGIESWKESNFISMYNRNHHDEKVIFKQFKRAIEAAKDFYINYFCQVRQSIKGDKEINKAIEKSKDIQNIVLFSSNINESASIVSLKSPDTLLIVAPRTKTSWIIQSTPFVNKRFSTKCPTPLSWQGLSGKELIKVSGIKGLVFCHKSGFLCIFEGSKEESIKVARTIILINEDIIRE